MAKYNSDRDFTDYAHLNLAIPLIYDKLNWTVIDYDENKDINDGIDYLLIDITGKEISIQERFRDDYYQQYTDATLRFRRDFNPNPARVKSEFYKIKADYLVYGITNGSKFLDKRHALTDFIKLVVLDLKYLQEKYENGKIKIPTSRKRTCWIEDDVLCCPENFNPDGSSSFLPFDIPLIYKLWGESPIFYQKGYL